MNDRYLYRAKRTDNGEWVEGQLIIIAKVNYYICTGKLKAETIKTAQIIPQMYKIDEDTICQCTGLADKNGKLIWENDILSHTYTKYEEKLTDYPSFGAVEKNKNYVLKLRT